MKHSIEFKRGRGSGPAAFGRLCVETQPPAATPPTPPQPPSGGCVLKLSEPEKLAGADCQPPSGGCVLKPAILVFEKIVRNQPPSGGCVLKLTSDSSANSSLSPAAFGRLCVETLVKMRYMAFVPCQPPSGGCVLKQAVSYGGHGALPQPPSGGCVLKPTSQTHHMEFHQPAAFGRLCVETRTMI